MEFNTLAASHPQRERFGPGSDVSCIAFDLSEAQISWAAWLRDLPCPTIGVGDGALAGICDVNLPNEKKLSRLSKNIQHAPLAAMVLVQHLRASENLSIEDALTAESLAYAAIHKGPEFVRWLAAHKGGPLPACETAPLIIDIRDKTLNLTFNQPETRNAIGVEMRDALCEALDLALSNDDILKTTLTGNGSTFSTGGAVEEFGEVSDPATAHWVRSLRLPAWRLARIKNFHVHVNGASIGAGTEIAAFGTHVTANSKAWFQLPELKYGLIPGAGGTASIPRRIGRQKTCYMALSMEKISSAKALEWGLIDTVID